MGRSIRWGIISTAMINDVVIDGIRKAARSELAAVASRDPKRASAYAAQQALEVGQQVVVGLNKFTQADKPWIAWEWLWDVMFAGLHSLGEMTAVVLATEPGPGGRTRCSLHPQHGAVARARGADEASLHRFRRRRHRHGRPRRG